MSTRFRAQGAALAVAAALLACASATRADAPAASLVRLLQPRSHGATPARRHPLADARGRIPVTVALPSGVDASALGLFLVGPGIAAGRLEPSAVEQFAALHPALHLVTSPPRRALLDAAKKWNRLAAFRGAVKGSGVDGRGDGVVVGIIDTGIDIRHPDFLDADGKTRIEWLFDVSAPSGRQPELEEDLGCTKPQHSPCAIYSAADLDGIIAEGGDTFSDPSGHGTHVASIAAGNGGTVGKQRYAGIAPNATLIVANAASNGGFQDDDVLQAATFIFERAALLGMPAVINLSVGGDFGPHDGTSHLERSLAAMVGDDKPGRAIVVAAGNSGTLRSIEGITGGPFGVHTEAHVTEGSVTRVPLVAGASKDGQGFIWITVRPGDDIDVALEGPGGERWIGFTSNGAESGYDDGDGTTAAVVNNLPSADSKITTGMRSAVVVIDGAWADRSEFAVLLRGTGDAALWVVGQGDVGPEKPIGLVFQRAMLAGTITVPASHPNLLAVGCTINRVTWKPLDGHALELQSIGDGDPIEVDSACYFSAAGPTPLGVAKPDISAPGAFVVAAMSSGADPREHAGSLFDDPNACPDDRPCFVVDERHALTSGTSMSAPQVAGAVALLMQLDRSLTQARVTEILQAGARKPLGIVPFDYQVGPGALDLMGALAALAEERASSIDPELSKSWYSLSSPYARPDPNWPVWGTVELRRADGSIAAGLDGTKLALAIDRGVIVQQLTKVRRGMWRFAFAGAPGAIGERVTVEVTYDGVSLGVRELPIGNDVWTADGVVDAVGGACACRAAAADARTTPGFVTLLLTTGLVWARRQRRRRVRTLL